MFIPIAVAGLPPETVAQLKAFMIARAGGRPGPSFGAGPLRSAAPTR